MWILNGAALLFAIILHLATAKPISTLPDQSGQKPVGADFSQCGPVHNATSDTPEARDELEVPSTLGTLYTCYPYKTFKSKRVDSRECYAAALNLPSLIEITKFHKGGNEDPYKLSKRYSAGLCTIKIDIDGDVDVSSWALIAQRAGFVIAACQGGIKTSIPYLASGGEFRMGENGKIVVTVGRDRPSLNICEGGQAGVNGTLDAGSHAAVVQSF